MSDDHATAIPVNTHIFTNYFMSKPTSCRQMFLISNLTFLSIPKPNSMAGLCTQANHLGFV